MLLKFSKGVELHSSSKNMLIVDVSAWFGNNVLSISPLNTSSFQCQSMIHTFLFISNKRGLWEDLFDNIFMT